jgi:hypothetical protein
VKVFFDVDYTILSYDNTIRPGTHEVFEKLVADGHEIYIWSGQGLRWAELYAHKLDGYVSGVFHKPTWDYIERLEELGVTVLPDFVIDDYAEIVEEFGGYFVKEFYREKHADDEMYAIYEAICQHVANGSAEHAGYRPRPSELEARLAALSGRSDSASA